jgi:hypothetical protein
VLSWAVIFIRGLKIDEFFYYLQMVNNYIHSPILKYFYLENTGLYPSHKFLWGLTKTTKIFFFNFSVCMLVFYGFFLFFAKIPGFKGKNFLQAVGFIALYILFPKDFFKNISNTTSLGWIAVGTAVILFVVLISLCINKKLFKGNFLQNFSQIDLKNKIFVLTAVAGILSSLKSFFFIYLHIYGTYFIPLLLLVNFAFLFEKLPDTLGFLNKNAWKKAGFTVIFLLGIIYMLTSLHFARKIYTYPIETQRGKIYTIKTWGPALDKLVNYINSEIPSEKTFMMMPEGLLINFLTGRDSNNRFYSLTPDFAEVFEKQIIQDIKRKKINFIFITNQDTMDYGFRYFGEDYGKNIYNYVRNNYKFLRKIEEPGREEVNFSIEIYKRNT